MVSVVCDCRSCGLIEGGSKDGNHKSCSLSLESRVLRRVLLSVLLLSAAAAAQTASTATYIHAYGGTTVVPAIDETEGIRLINYGGGLEVKRLYIGMEGVRTIGVNEALKAVIKKEIPGIDAARVIEALNARFIATGFRFIGGPTVIKDEKYSITPVAIVGQLKFSASVLGESYSDSTVVYGGGIIARMNISKSTALHIGPRYIHNIGLELTAGIAFGL